MKRIEDYPSNTRIAVTEVMDYVRELCLPEDIDHHGFGTGMDDLYLRITRESKWIVHHMENTALVSTFKDNIEGDWWYELPFLYGENDEEESGGLFEHEGYMVSEPWDV